MTSTGTRPDEGGARSAVTPPAGLTAAPAGPSAAPAGPSAASVGALPRRRVTASAEVIARILDGEPIKPTRAERNARMPSALKVASTAMTILATALLGFAIYLLFVSRLHHDRAQLTAYADFRSNLALATAPIGQGRPDDPNTPLVPGTAVALLDIPRLGLKEVVFEGTDGAVLTDGPGHMRSTVLPGQAGVSVLMGRSTMYGGPFGGIGSLAPDDTITVTTGQGVHTYHVLDVRRPGDPQPPPLPGGAGRLTLVTAYGNPFVATDVIRVDADLTSEVQPRPPTVVTPHELLAPEYPMGIDRRGWLGLIAVGVALVIVAGAAGWTRYAWGGPQTWLVCVPLLAMLGIAAADQAVRLFPNLI